MSATTTPPVVGGSRAPEIVKVWLRRNATVIGAYALCAVLFVAATIYSPTFASAHHVRQLIIFASFIGFAALGQTVVVLAGGLDLSVPWLMAFGGLELSHWGHSLAVPDGIVVVLIVLAGAGIGLVSGLGVSLLRIPPIVMTLGVGGLVEGFLLYDGSGQLSGSHVPQIASTIISGSVGPIPILWFVWLAIAISTGVVLRRTPFGRRIYGVGLSPTVAHLSGVNVARIRAVTYVIAGATSAFAGVLLAGYIGQAYLDMGSQYLFGSIAAVAVGGASILGGSGTYWGTLAGALTLTFLSALLPELNLGDSALDIVYGLVILFGIFLARLGRSLSEANT